MAFKRLLSPSAINLYFQCPRRFYYRYVMRMPVKESIHTVRGKAVHTVLEKIYDIDPKTLTNTNYKKIILGEVSRVFQEEWTKNLDKIRNLGLSEDEIDFYHKDSTIQLDKWAEKFTGQLEKKLKEVFMIKKAWEYFFPKHRELKLISDNYGLIGFADQVLDLSGRNLIIDYKTSKSPKLSEDYVLQMACYNLMYKEKFKTEAETYLWFLKFGLKKVQINEPIINKTVAKIRRVHNALKSDNILDYPKNQSPLCRWENAQGSGECDFYEDCLKQKELSS